MAAIIAFLTALFHAVPAVESLVRAAIAEVDKARERDAQQRKADKTAAADAAIDGKASGISDQVSGKPASPEATHLLLFLLFSSYLLLSSGCTYATRIDNGARLIARPDFPAARDAAPEWCRDALHTIADLEYQIEKQ